MPARQIIYRVHEAWTPPLIEQISDFFMRRPEPLPWGGRWNTGTDYFQWKFARNPTKPSVAALAYDGDEIVGTAVVSYKTVRVEGVDLLVGELGDLYVAEAQRGQGVFTRLVSEVKASALRGAAFLYCVPNAQGHNALIATKHFVAVPQSEHATWLRALRPMALVLAKLEHAAAIETPPIQGYGPLSKESFQPIVGHYGSEVRVGMTTDWFDYRVVQYPDRRAYQIIRPNSQVPDAAAIIKQVTYRGMTAVLIGRIEAPTLAGYGAALNAATDHARRVGAAIVALWAPARSPYVSNLLRRLYVPVQRKRLAVTYGGSGREIHQAVARLRIEMLDSDKI